MRLRHLALPSAAGLVLLAVPFAPAAQAAAGPVCAGGTCTVSYATTGAPESFTVPAGVTELVVGLTAGSGGSGHPQNDTGPTNAGGDGGAVVVRVPVTPGETLTVVAGGRGSDSTPDSKTPAPGGYGGGGDATAVSGGTDGAGGGGSFLFRGPAVLAAVGGGGGGGFDDGGDGGAGGPGSDGSAGSRDISGGGASTTAPGAAGQGSGGQAGTGPASGPSTFGTGGVGQPVGEARTCPAGGGGGGYYGGGAGGCDFVLAKTASLQVDDPTLGDYGAGGGGSGFLANGVTALETGTHRGDGSVVIGYAGRTATATTLVTDDTTLAPGQEAGLTATVTGPAVTVGTAATTAAAVAAKVGGSATALTAPAAAAPKAATSTPSTACGAAPCTVTFLVNGAALGAPVALDPATGTAKVVFTAGSDLGVRRIVARYDGNALYAPSTSAAVEITVAGLADTGPDDVAPMLATAAALLVVGAGLTVSGRRRPQIGVHRAA